ncbi:MAG: hypothetical protein R6W82_07065 [bacterium]
MRKSSRRGLFVLAALAGIHTVPAAAQGPGTSLELLRSEAAQAVLQAEAADGHPVKCAVPALFAALAQSGRAAGGPQRVRFSYTDPESFDSPGGGFRLHYTRSGVHAVLEGDADDDGVPDFIEAAAAALDSVRAGYLALGWREPPVDDVEDPRYDVYFLDLPGFFGYVEPDETPDRPPYVSSSHMVLENDYPPGIYGHPPLESLRVTVAHEYHHAIQLAYSLPGVSPALYDYTWFAELSATYHEDIFYDGINDYYFYLPSFQNNPEVSLDADGITVGPANHKYGAALWGWYMHRVFGESANRRVWEIVGEDRVTPLEAHRRFLQDEGTDLQRAWGDFTLWQVHTGSRADPARYFEEGAAYPEVRTVDVPDLETVSIDLPRLAAAYHLSPVPDPAPGGVALRVSPLQDSEWGIGAAGEGPSSILSAAAVSASPAGSGASLELLDWSSYAFLLRWGWSGDNTDLTGTSVTASADLEGRVSTHLTSDRVGGSGFHLLQNYPNPFRPGRMENTFFAFTLDQTDDVSLEVRSMNGRRVWYRRLGGMPPGRHFTADMDLGWDGRDEGGGYVSSGIYLLVARAGDTTRVLQFSVIR